MNVVDDLFQSVVKYHRKMGRYPTSIQLYGSLARDLIRDAKPLYADPDWHVTMCGVRVELEP